MSERETEFDQDQGTEDVVVDALIETQDRYSSTKDIDRRAQLWDGLSDEEREGMAQLGYAGPVDLDLDEAFEGWSPISPTSPTFGEVDSQARLDVAAAIKKMRRGEVEVTPDLRDTIEARFAEASVLPPEQGSELVQRAAHIVHLLEESAGRAPERVALTDEQENADGSVTKTGYSRSGTVLFETHITAEEIEAAEEAEEHQQAEADNPRPWGDKPYEVTLEDVQEWSPKEWAAFEEEYPLYAEYVIDENGQTSSRDFQRWKSERRSQREALGWRRI